MQTLMNDYFMIDSSEEEYLAIKRLLERQRILGEARLANQARENLKNDYDKLVKSSATNTKTVINEIKKELDTGIKGQAQKSIQTILEEKLSGYENISS